MKVGDIYRLRYCFVKIADITMDHVFYRKHNKTYKRLIRTFLKKAVPVDMELFNKDEITINRLEWDWADVHSDAGRCGIRFNCPVCGGEVIWAEGAWWDMRCDCRKWDIEIKITGYSERGD